MVVARTKGASVFSSIGVSRVRLPMGAPGMLFLSGHEGSIASQKMVDCGHRLILAVDLVQLGHRRYRAVSILENDFAVCAAGTYRSVGELVERKRICNP